MAYTVSIAPVDPTAVIGEETTFTATGAGAATPGTESFVWTVDGQAQASVIATLAYVAASPAGSKVVKVVATNTPSDGDPETAEATVTLTVTKKVITGASVTISGPSTVEVGDSYTLTADVEGLPSGVTAAYKWANDSTEQTLTRVAGAEGPEVSTVDVTLTGTDYETLVLNATKTVTVEAAEPVIPAECPILYVHPLPWRSSAYIWAGWWVMDAIQKLTTEGKDWKKAKEEDTPYYCHLAVLAKMITDYPEVDVQESRNGRIVHKSALEAGIIY